MKSFEALQQAIAGKTVNHAKILHLSTALVNKWQEPCVDFTDSGAFNPLDRVETIIETSLAQGTDPLNALAPVQYLAQRFNQILIPVPEAKNGSVNDAAKALLRVIEEFGHLSTEAAEAFGDNKLKQNEIKKIEKEVWDLITQASVFLFKIKSVEGK